MPEKGVRPALALAFNVHAAGRAVPPVTALLSVRVAYGAAQTKKYWFPVIGLINGVEAEEVCKSGLATVGTIPPP